MITIELVQLLKERRYYNTASVYIDYKSESFAIKGKVIVYGNDGYVDILFLDSFYDVIKNEKNFIRRYSCTYNPNTGTRSYDAYSFCANLDDILEFLEKYDLCRYPPFIKKYCS